MSLPIFIFRTIPASFPANEFAGEEGRGAALA
jgi:hypothetical protein